MIIQSCLACKFHLAKHEEKERVSYCQKENCWSQFSKCILNKALNRFLDQESSGLVPTQNSVPPVLDFAAKKREADDRLG